MDLGFSNSFTHSVDNSQPIMDHSFHTKIPITFLPTTNVNDTETMVASVPQEKIRKIDEEIEKF
jgi:hypothetical protein